MKVLIPGPRQHNNRGFRDFSTIILGYLDLLGPLRTTRLIRLGLTTVKIGFGSLSHVRAGLFGGTSKLSHRRKLYLETTREADQHGEDPCREWHGGGMGFAD